MKSIKTPNHPSYHWSTLRPLEEWVHGLYNSCLHKLSMFIYLSMVWVLECFINLGTGFITDDDIVDVHEVLDAGFPHV